MDRMIDDDKASLSGAACSPMLSAHSSCQEGRFGNAHMGWNHHRMYKLSVTERSHLSSDREEEE